MIYELKSILESLGLTPTLTNFENTDILNLTFEGDFALVLAFNKDGTFKKEALIDFATDLKATEKLLNRFGRNDNNGYSLKATKDGYALVTELDTYNDQGTILSRYLKFLFTKDDNFIGFGADDNE